ncbi:MAG: nitrous oxide reductase accessory protein NosL [Microthrixaceae bacterium]
MIRRPRPTTELTLVLIAALALVAALAGCGGEAATGPPEIHYGRDTCAECHMIISEARFAAAYRDASGSPFVFDDIGDMIEHGRRAGVLDEITAWVHDYESEDWIDAPAAWFVKGGSVATPMAGGIVAFAGRSGAEQYIGDNGGELLRWAELTAAEPTTAPITDPTTDPTHKETTP